MGNFFQYALGKIIGTKNDRELKRLNERIQAINVLEPEMQKLQDSDFPLRTEQFKARLAEGETLDDLLPEAFALCREAGRRTLNMRHFDVQLVGGMVLHEGKIAEMKTGEGKTLVATLPVYLNALEGKGVHVVTVNDYLANRDAAWMGPIYRLLGLTVGVIVHDLDDEERKAAYACDVTYGTNNEFGFDYLRDNMKFDLQDCVQRGHHYAIVDEVDSILIDEARTPLIISGSSEESTEKYYKIDKIIPHLEEKVDYEVDEKHRQATITESGIAKCEKLLGLENMYDPANMEYIHHIYQALKAHTLFKRDRDYVVKDGEVIIVDEFTGRLMPGRRWSDGLHQAIEAKENVKIERENQTLATITFQNYFRMYKKLAGMTGTAETEAAEFEKIYKLEVVVIPTNRPLIRHEFPDVVYRTEREKFNAVIEEIKEYHLRGQPVLVGTIAIEKSERLSAALRKSGVWPTRLLELAKAGGLEGPRLQKWAANLAEHHSDAVEWLVRAGVTASAAEEMLKQGRFKALQTSSNGAGAQFLQAIQKQAQKTYHPRSLPPVDDAYAQRIVALVKSVDKAHLPLLDYLISVECTPRRLLEVLEMREVKHSVLNAKQHEREAQIVAQAGRVGAVTISTNMAGRGTDIILGGNPEFIAREEFRRAPEKYREQGIDQDPPERPPAVFPQMVDAVVKAYCPPGSPPEQWKKEELRNEILERFDVDIWKEGVPLDSGSVDQLLHDVRELVKKHHDAVYQNYVDAYKRWREKWNQFVSQFKTTTDVEHEQVIRLGGLHILGTERHEARRIDNQLRGRAGRQGDPGSSRFYLSLEDDLLRIFAGERISKIMHRLGMEEGVPVESRLITKRIEAAQKTVEAQNFESRKHLLEYDDVMNKQRETIYGLRRQLLEGAEQRDYIMDAADRVVDWLVAQFCPKDQSADQWNMNGLRSEFWGRFGIDLRNREFKLDPKALPQLTDELKELVHQQYAEREKVWGPERMRQHERMLMLQVVDAQWKDHLLAMDHLKEGIGLRGYSQRDPLVEYKRESFDLFEAMMDRIEDETLRYLFLMRTPEEQEEMIRQYQRRKRREQAEMQMVGAGATEKPQQVIRRQKIGRNDPCPCGSGKKYKKCHGAPGPPPSSVKPSETGRPRPQA
ncbi:MAG TPA: preprotein translocase subunit SecA [Terriglobia bacterium]|jgi:preprotein translocase subunit SecA|nr:preprotein translocase subunit SecA [Terriglobia bacterium]